MPEDDYVPCVILGRDNPRQEWEFLICSMRKSVAWRSAFYIQEQERKALGHKSYQTAVQTRDDYDSKSRRLLEPPEGFEEMIRNEPVEECQEPVIQTEPQMAEVGPLIERPDRSIPSTKMVYTEPEL